MIPVAQTPEAININKESVEPTFAYLVEGFAEP